MAVKIGSARIDERGKITGGKAGDQTGKEVSTQNWYRRNSNPWRVLRPIDTLAGAKMAYAMVRACKNNRIGYDQYNRNSLYSEAAPKGFDPGKVMANCETDCSALVRVCCAYAGINVRDFNTSSEAAILLGSGRFVEMKGRQYTHSENYLRVGDVLVTRDKGHTVIVLSDGEKAGSAPVLYPKRHLGDRILRNGCVGEDVTELQRLLIGLDYDLGKWGSDGEFGDSTEIAVRLFQANHSLKIDGEVGIETLTVLLDEVAAGGDGDVEQPNRVVIKGGNCYIRAEPGLDGEIIGVAVKNTMLNYSGKRTEGWIGVKSDYDEGWVSAKYGVLIRDEN